MKKSLLLAAMVCALTACQTPREEPMPCPSCNPPARHFEIVTECSDYKEKDLGNGAYSQCRFCSSRLVLPVFTTITRPIRIAKLATSQAGTSKVMNTL